MFKIQWFKGVHCGIAGDYVQQLRLLQRRIGFCVVTEMFRAVCVLCTVPETLTAVTALHDCYLNSMTDKVKIHARLFGGGDCYRQALT